MSIADQIAALQADRDALFAQCDNCQKMFDPEDEDCFIGWHQSYGDCCQCAECVEKARAEAGFPFSGSF